MRSLAAAILVAVTVTTPLAAQNLVRWDQWKPFGDPAVKIVIDKDGVSFTPLCKLADCDKYRTGFTQVIDVPKAGFYQLSWSASMTETLRVHVELGGFMLFNDRNKAHMTITRVAKLPQGKTELRFSTGPYYTLNPTAEFQHPTLELIDSFEGAVKVTMKDYHQFAIGPTFTMEAKAHVLAVSAARLPTPVALPGFTGTLSLDPSVMVILATSTAGSISEDYWRFARLIPYDRPKLHVQTVTATGFGPVVSF